MTRDDMPDLGPDITHAKMTVSSPSLSGSGCIERHNHLLPVSV
ncbi:MAG: hypothetical protein N4A65_07335 [Cohaesibacter sp.]|nr:hypothetical protein [Cohaesibacter sp.]